MKLKIRGNPDALYKSLTREIGKSKLHDIGGGSAKSVCKAYKEYRLAGNMICQYNKKKAKQQQRP